jgi:succinate-semialdehyde dehydrogenase
MRDNAVLPAASGLCDRFAISVDPSTGQEIARYRLQDDAEQHALLEKAHDAQIQWAVRAIGERGDMLARLGATLRADLGALASLATAEMGKPITAARAEVEKCAALCDWYAAHAEALLADERVDVGTDGSASISHEPLGVVLGVMPWNFPFWQVLRAAVPILAAGNGFVLKHADNVQGCAHALARTFASAGLPDGLLAVLNVDRDALPNIIADRRIAAVTVTAGVAAGAAIAAEAGRNLKKSLLELGGSDPFIVCADADLEKAVAAAANARFRNAGQVCIAAKRLIVAQPIAAEFTERLIAAAARLSQGDPKREETTLGPMARERSRSELHAQVCESVRLGARLLMGGQVPEGPGAYYPATVLADVTSAMPVFREETFGPVAPVIVAETDEDAIRLANDSDFGLSAAIWCQDPAHARQMARRIATGGVFINGISESDPRVPIGGIKHSGYGRELSHFGLREFTNAKLVWARGG